MLTKLFFRYLIHCWKGAALFALFAAVCATVFALYRLPVPAVGYAALICGFFFAVFIALDYGAFARRYRALARLKGHVAEAMDSLPEPAGPLEAEYQRLLRIAADEQAAMTAAASRSSEEAADYYTLWAHQIKTPIAAMRLLLQQSADSSEKRELSAELQRIEQYVEMAMGYLRLESETTDYVLRRVELDAVVRQAVRKYAAQFIRKKLTLTYEPLSCAVLTDEKWLLFVVEQLLSNALKYTRRGGVTITLEPEKTLCIRDTGIGIAPEDLPRVCEKGYTGYNGRSDKKATGIGLYLCRRTLQKLGHTIAIESVPDRGTTVRVNLAQAELSVE